MKKHRAPSATLSRRRFLQTTGCLAFSSALVGQNIIGANCRVRIALVGCGRRGRSLLGHFLKLDHVELVALCDADRKQMAGVAGHLEKKLAGGIQWPGLADVRKFAQIQDYRKVYERSDIDAVVIATPNHWHALHAVQAMQAGKHVYVEKPVSFTFWEGLQLEAAERRYGKVIAAGYQNRSDRGPQAGIRYVQVGKLGEIRKVRSLCYRNRAPIGRMDHPLIPQRDVDYDLWLGPAQDLPIYRPELHYDWHWDFNTGNGDVGNQGVHEIDMVCWLLGEPQLPASIGSIGNRFAWDDAGNTPNMQTVWFKQGDVDVILEINDMTLAPNRNVPAHRLGTRVGIIAECDHGILKGGRGGMVACELDGRTVIEKFPGDGGGSHQKNFINAVLANDASLLKSRIADAHRSASLAHLGNISHRCGSEVSLRELHDLLGSNDDVQAIVAEQTKQLAAWGIQEPRYCWGKPLEVDPAREIILSHGVGAEFSGPHYRKGFEMPQFV